MIFNYIEKIYKAAIERFRPSDFVIPTGFSLFDQAMDGGFREGELIVISGPTGQGKTSFCMAMNVNFHKKGVPTLWFSYEMNPWYLKEKFVKMKQTEDLLVYVPTLKSDSPENGFTYVTELQWINSLMPHIDKYAIKIVVIDHLHYIVPLVGYMGNFSLLIGKTVRDLKKIAEKKNIIIILVAHTRKVYQDEKLDLSSIRDSSLIAQESDYVFLIERIKENDIWTDKARIQLAKNRRTGQMKSMDFLYSTNFFLPIETNYQTENVNWKPV